MGWVQGLVPRGLIESSENDLKLISNPEGLCHVRLKWDKGQITGIEQSDLQTGNTVRHFLLPRLLEPHAHLDKAFTWDEFPNFDGTYSGALAANFQEHKTRSNSILRERVERSLVLALENGLRAIRSHVDSTHSFSESNWDLMCDLKRKWKDVLELQLVALVPVEYWNSFGGEKLARRVAITGGLLGGVVLPPFKPQAMRKALKAMISLAEKHGCGIDVHIDENHNMPADGLKQLIKVLDDMKVSIPITCSHLSSMSLLSPRTLGWFAERMAFHRVKVIALPLTNAWLLGQNQLCTPSKRPLAPIKQLQRAGVTVAVGGDNVQDPWFPLGNLDPISLMSFALPLAQLAPWYRMGLAPFTTASANVMGLTWDGVLRVNAPADLMLIEASSWPEALTNFYSRKILVKGTWLDQIQLGQYLSLPN